MLNILLREKEKISELSSVMSLSEKISKNPSFIIYVDLRITTLATESIELKEKFALKTENIYNIKYKTFFILK